MSPALQSDVLRTQSRTLTLTLTYNPNQVGDPLRYVGVVLLLGVTPLQHPLLARQGFYTVDGTKRRS